MTSTSNIIGDHLASKRLALKLLKTEVAEKSGVALSTVSRIESGEVRPTVDVLLKLADALELDLTELLAKLGAHTDRSLPEFSEYLREKYGLSDQAIDRVAAFFWSSTYSESHKK